MDKEKIIYLDRKILQKDMRVRMPASVKENLNVEEGCFFKIYLDKDDNSLILKVDNEK